MSAESFSYQMKTPSRGDGFNAVIHAAYVSGKSLYDEREDAVQSLGMRERVVHTEISAPENSPRWIREVVASQDREVLWNRAEAAERHARAQVVRQVILSIDDGLYVRRKDGTVDKAASVDLQANTVRRHVEAFVGAGMVADWGIHWDKEDRNPHAHIILTRRLATEQGFAPWKDGQSKPASRGTPPERPWNDRGLAERSRADWARVQNEALEQIKCAYRVDHRSYERRGLDLKAEEKHFGKGERKERNRTHHAKQVGKLIRNPRPIFDAISQSYVDVLSMADLTAYARRFARDTGREPELLAALAASPELVKLKGNCFTTQGIQEKRARADLAGTLEELPRMTSWRELDDSLHARGWRMEAVSRNGRIVQDIVHCEEPWRRLSAYRLSQRLGPKATRAQFGKSRVGHELAEIARQKRTCSKAWQDEIWSAFRSEAARDHSSHKHEQNLDWAEFAKRHQAFHRRFGRREPSILSIGTYVAYRVSKWMLGRRERKMRQTQQERQEAFEKRRQERYEAAARKARIYADEQARETQHDLGKHKEKIFGKEETKTVPTPKDRRSTLAHLQAEWDKLRAEHAKVEAALDKLAVNGRSDRVLSERAKALAVQMMQSPFWQEFQKKEEKLAKYIERQAETPEEKRKREREQDRHRGRGR